MPRAPYHLDGIKAVLAANGEMRQGKLAEATELTIGTLIAGVRPGVRSGEVLERREGRSVFYRLAEGVEVGAASEPGDGKVPKFNAALWADGELILWNVEMNEDGRSLTLGADETRMLCRLLHGQGPEE